MPMCLRAVFRRAALLPIANEAQTFMNMDSIPRIAPGCRLHPTDEVLLIPEGALQLSGPSREILQLLDGHRNVKALVAELLQQYPGSDAEEVRGDVLSLLDRMAERGVVRV
jgi:pyrroloquinoline quinone biosynthesis protein D